MLFRKTLTMCAVALLAIGTSAFAQDVTTPLLGLLAADDEKRAVMKILRRTQHELDMAKQLLDIGDLSGVSLSPVQVDQMLNI